MPDTPTPAMAQYQEFKKQFPDAILFFHIGDFYETFGKDAELVSRELDIVLTSRSKESGIPLAGVPHHAAEAYIARLVKKGYSVALCEQVEDPKKAKGLVKRDILRVITPGTVMEPGFLGQRANYLMSISPGRGKFGVSFLDVSTGEFFVTETEGDSAEDLRSEVSRYMPGECIIPESHTEKLAAWLGGTGIPVKAKAYRDEAFDVENGKRVLLLQFSASSLEGYGCGDMPHAISAAGAALSYAKETQRSALSHISGLSTRMLSRYMVLDAITLRNLEILQDIRGDSRGSTLAGVLDLTGTPMGSRLLLRALASPLLDTNEINGRLDAVEFLYKNAGMRAALGEKLRQCADIERIAGRISYGNVSPRDLVSLTRTLLLIPGIKSLFSETPAAISHAIADMKDLGDAAALIQASIVDDPPALARNGNVIRAGFNKQLDELRELSGSGKQWIASLQQREREKTGIKSLKIGYNQVFGYYIEVTKPNVSLVPSHYERKQTTSNAERYTIPELREKEMLIQNADESLSGLEIAIFNEVVVSLRAYVGDLKYVAGGIAALDMYHALSEVAVRNNYVRPVLEQGSRIVIRDGRHPVVELGAGGGFVPNDTLIDTDEDQILIITGANMAGKSTYMRAVALICIMAQTGSFVPAAHASVGIVDRIFTRVGAFDDLSRGQSTFMVEMTELANILNNVKRESLVILDEIGRGTSTLDGYGIAKAVLEYLHAAHPRTLFATHFHQLTEVESELKRVRNYHFAVKDAGSEVVFLRKLVPGATDKSYGIHVASLAGVPRKVVARAGDILKDAAGRGYTAGKMPRFTQMMLLDPVDEPPMNPALVELLKLRIDEMTPIAALNKLSELKELAGNRTGRA